MSLKLYRISQTINKGYDTYRFAVVVAGNEEEARKIHPDGSGAKWHGDWELWDGPSAGEEWCAPEHVYVEFVGIPDERFKSGDIVCASFNAG